MRKEARDRTLKKNNYKCVHCGSTKNLEVDHIIPISKGGEHSEFNYQILCRKCNRKKKDKVDWINFFIINKSPDYILLNDKFIDIIPNLSPEENLNIFKVIFKEHKKYWENK